MIDNKMLPRYPIYVPSKGRHDCCLTANFLIADSVPFKLVIESQERDEYASRYGEDHILVLPFCDKGSVVPARNWIKEHAIKAGHERHWQIDDNIKGIRRVWKGKQIPCHSGIAFAAAEDFVDRYENIAISGLNYTMWIRLQPHREPAFLLNCRVYSCVLMLNSIPHRWRAIYNEDVDICLQVLADGWCTVLINAFLIEKIRTMTMKGGNTDEIYHGDGRLKMAKAMERLWPGVVDVKRRWQRPQHVIKGHWTKFDTPLRFKKDINLEDFELVDEYGMELTKVKDIQSERLRRLYEEACGAET